MPNRKLFSVSLLACAVAATAAVPIVAQTANAQVADVPPGAQVQQHINLPAGSLSTSLNALARQFGITLAADPALVNNLQAPAVTGNYSAQQALNRLLANTGLAAAPAADGSYSLIERPKNVGVLKSVKVSADADTGYAGAPLGVVVRESSGTALFGAADRRQVPFSVNIVGSTEIKNRQATTFSQALATDPSVANGYDDAIPYDTVSVRGFAISNLIYDGHVYWDAYTTRGVESIDKLEVLRGPAAFRYGFVAPGGVLNIVSKQPTDETFTSVTTGVTDRGRASVHLDTGSRLGEGEKFGYRVNAALADGDLWMDDTEKERQMFSLATDLALSSDAVLYLGYEIDNTRSQGGGQEGYADVGLDTDGRLPDPIPDPRNQWQPDWGYSKINEQLANARVNWKINADWTLDTAVRAGKKSIESWGGVTWLTTWQANGDHALSYNGYKWDDVDTFSNLTYLQGKVATGEILHNVTAGVSYTDFDGEIYWPSNASLPGIPSNLYDPATLVNPGPGEWTYGGNDQQEQKGMFISNMMDIGTLHPLIGLRQSEFTAEDPWSNGSSTNKKTTPMFGLSYDFSDAVTFYASHAKGLEEGGRAPVGAANQFEQMPALDTKSSEMGVKSDLLDGAATLDIAAFKLEKTAAFTDPTTNRYGQSGIQEHRGLEVMVKGRVLEPLELSTGLTYIDANLEGNPATAGNKPENVPPVKAVVYGEYQTPIDGLYLTGLVSYVDKREYNTPNRHQTDAYSLLNFGVRYEMEIGESLLIGRLNIDNATDQRYWANAFTWGGGRGAPRVSTLSLEFQM